MPIYPPILFSLTLPSTLGFWLKFMNTAEGRKIVSADISLNSVALRCLFWFLIYPIWYCSFHCMFSHGAQALWLHSVHFTKMIWCRRRDSEQRISLTCKNLSSKITSIRSLFERATTCRSFWLWMSSKNTFWCLKKKKKVWRKCIHMMLEQWSYKTTVAGLLLESNAGWRTFLSRHTAETM